MKKSENSTTRDFDKYLDKLPKLLRTPARHTLENVFTSLDLCDIPLSFMEELTKVLTCSEFVARWAQREPTRFKQLLDSGDLQRHYLTTTYQKKCQTEIDLTHDKPGLSLFLQQLRQLRQREMVRIAWRDITGTSCLEETLKDLSRLADACIKTALDQLHTWAIADYGQPLNQHGTEQRLIVIALGKLGGQELNFSSDIDLMFVYPEEGQTKGKNKTLSNSEFFNKLGQQLIHALDETTADGFVFRVDMRLRPFGKSGALAIDFDTLENYYQTHGREWERYALVKARFLTDNNTIKTQLRDILRPFIYRRYLDFNVYESLRNMKHLINKEVKHKANQKNVKLGAGGIREIEFISQTFQLIRGGIEPSLQNPHLLPTLKQLSKFNYLPEYVSNELTQAYIFLRNTEHRIQEYADQQTHLLPVEAIAQARLAFSMNFTDWDAFELELEKHQVHVRNHFDQVFLSPQIQQENSTQHELSNLLDDLSNEESSLESIAAAGYQNPSATHRELVSFLQSYQYRALSSNGQKQLNQLMPLLVAAIGKLTNPDQTLLRIVSLLEKISQRTTYVALLLENPMALSQLVKLCAASAWIANLLSRHPSLLDELLDPRFLYAPSDKLALENELEQFLTRVPKTDLEAQMETIRQFKQVNVLRIAAADIAEAIPLMQVSDHLTWIAETILQQILTIAWQELVEKHGSPLCDIKGEIKGEINAQPTEPGFTIIAYGKLGGKELGYGSDLDLVFLHSCSDSQAMTGGNKPITSAVFFARLGQRIIHMISIHTSSGVLYEVDMRLRPSGASGLLVSHIDAYSDYQMNKAWTWEHQALVRARAVAGDPGIATEFNNIRKKTLNRKSDIEKLKTDVTEMRERMRKSNEQRDARQSHKQGKEQLFDIKQGRGGIADIEFMVQYGVLAWSYEYPELLDFSDNICLLACFEKITKMNSTDASQLAEAYRTYRDKVHKLTLLEKPAVVKASEFEQFRKQVIDIWDPMFR